MIRFFISSTVFLLASFIASSSPELIPEPTDFSEEIELWGNLTNKDQDWLNEAFAEDLFENSKQKEQDQFLIKAEKELYKTLHNKDFFSVKDKSLDELKQLNKLAIKKQFKDLIGKVPSEQQVLSIYEILLSNDDIHLNPPTAAGKTNIILFVATKLIDKTKKSIVVYVPIEHENETWKPEIENMASDLRPTTQIILPSKKKIIIQGKQKEPKLIIVAKSLARVRSRLFKLADILSFLGNSMSLL